MIGGSVKLFKIDTGADISVMTSESFNALKEKPQLKPTTVNLMSPGGRVSTQGEITVETTYKSHPYKFRAIVVQGTRNNLLSRSVAVRMGLIQRADELKNVFGTCGVMETDPVSIHLKADVQPYAVMTAR